MKMRRHHGAKSGDASKKSEARYLTFFLNSRLWIVGLIYFSGALIDDFTTYFYVKLLGLYAEANPIIAAYWMDKPLWLWVIRDFAVLLMALLIAKSFRRFVDFLRSRSPNSTVLTCLRNRWLWPLYLVAIVRCLPAAHNALLIYFGIETPLTDLLHDLLAFLLPKSF